MHLDCSACWLKLILVFISGLLVGCAILKLQTVYTSRSVVAKDIQSDRVVYRQRTAAASSCKDVFRPETISTTAQTRYMLYGEGEMDSDTRRQLHNYIRSLTSRAAPGGRHLWHRHRRHFSQIGASQLVDRLLGRRRGGTFLECGAANGEKMSNSLFFEKQRGWTGVLVEANPRRFRQLLEKNRDAYAVRACLSVTNRPQVFKFRVPTVAGGAIVGHMQERSIRTFKRQGHDDISVQCFPLNDLADALHIRRINYLSLDIEGAELEVLKTVDFRRLVVDVLTIEYNGHARILEALRTFFKATGLYREVTLLHHQDVVFMRTST